MFYMENFLNNKNSSTIWSHGELLESRNYNNYIGRYLLFLLEALYGLLLDISSKLG